MKSFLELRPLMKEAWAIYEAFRRFGLSSDQIFLILTNDRIFMQAVQEEKEFGILLGFITPDLTTKEIEQEWAEACQAIKTATYPDLKQVWENSKIYSRLADVVLAMEEKGFKLPAFEEYRAKQAKQAMN